MTKKEGLERRIGKGRLKRKGWKGRIGKEMIGMDGLERKGLKKGP
jgi:hypothetical protein